MCTSTATICNNEQGSQWEDKAPLCKHLGDRRFSSHRQTLSACQSAHAFSSMNTGDKAKKGKGRQKYAGMLKQLNRWVGLKNIGRPAFRKTKHYFRDTKWLVLKPFSLTSVLPWIRSDLVTELRQVTVQWRHGLCQRKVLRRWPTEGSLDFIPRVKGTKAKTWKLIKER